MDLLRLIAAYDQLAATLDQLQAEMVRCRELSPPSSEQNARMANAYAEIAALGAAVAAMAGLLGRDM